MIKKTLTTPRSPPLSDDLDASLIKATLEGNQKSFDDLITKHQSALFLMVHHHLRQREEAEDIVQQVFLRAYQHLSSFRGESKFFTWLYTIALNLIRNHVRQRKTRRTDSLDVPGKTEGGPGPQLQEKSPSPEKAAQDRWDLDRVRVALEKLPHPYRAIFTLHYFQHLSLKDVALRIDRPLGTVKVYLHRSRKMVLSLLLPQD